jgi:hypothetical protein
MSRYKAPGYINEMRRGERRSANKERNGFWKWAKKTSAVVFPILALLGGYRWFSPQIAIVANPPLTADIFSSPFTITNTSNFAVMNVTPSCVTTKTRSQKGNSIGNDDTYNYMPPIDELETGVGMSTIFCRSGIAFLKPATDPIVFADVTITVAYRPSWFPFTKHKVSRFIGLRDSDEKFRWLPK